MHTKVCIGLDFAPFWYLMYDFIMQQCIVSTQRANLSAHDS